MAFLFKTSSGGGIMNFLESNFLMYFFIRMAYLKRKTGLHPFLYFPTHNLIIAQFRPKCKDLEIALCSAAGAAGKVELVLVADDIFFGADFVAVGSRRIIHVGIIGSRIVSRIILIGGGAVIG